MHRLTQRVGAVGAAALVAALLVVAEPPAPAAAATGDITTVAGGSAPLIHGNAADIARHGDWLYIADRDNSVVLRRHLLTGEQTVYVGTWGVSGGGTPSGVGGPADQARLDWLGPIAVDSAGNLYLEQGSELWRVDVGTTIIQRVAGTGTMGNTGDGGDPLSADLEPLASLEVDAAGDVYLGFDRYVRRIDVSANVIDRFAGTGAGSGPAGWGGSATSAEIGQIRAIVVHPNGDVFLYDNSNNVVLRVDGAGDIHHYAGVIGTPGSLDGPVASAELGVKPDMVLGPNGALYLLDGDAGLIRVIDPTGSTVSTLGGVVGSPNPWGAVLGMGGPFLDAHLGTYVKSLSFDATGGLYISAADFLFYSDSTLTTVVDATVPPSDAGDSGPADAAQLAGPSDVLRVGSHLYVSERKGNRVRRIDLRTGTISTFAGSATGVGGSRGDGGPAAAALLFRPTGLAFDGHGIVIAGDEGRIRRVDLATGTIETVAGGATSGYSGDHGPATSAEISPGLLGVTVAPNGNLMFSDTGNSVIRCVGCEGPGIISTIAGTGNPGFSPDGTLATNADLGLVFRLVVTPDGGLVYADGTNQLVRRIAPNTQTLQTLAGQAGDSSSLGDNGLAVNASLAGPTALRFDAHGNLDISEQSTGSIRRIDATTGIITTIAGTGTPGFSGDGGPATAAQLTLPSGFTTDPGPNLYVADVENNRVRRIAGEPAALTVAAPNLTVPAGATDTLPVTVTNTGPGLAVGPVIATVAVPTGLSVSAATGTGWICSSATAQTTCTHSGHLAASANAAFTLTVNATGTSAGPMPLTVSAETNSEALPTVTNLDVIVAGAAPPSPPTPTAPGPTPLPTNPGAGPVAAPVTPGVTAGRTLPRTGFDSWQQLAIALVLIGAGVAGTVGARPRRDRRGGAHR